MTIKIHKTIEVMLTSKFARFLLTGGLNTLFGYSVFALFIYLNVSYSLSLLFSTLAGIVFNYNSFGYFVFSGSKGRNVFYKFVLSYFLLYVINLSILNILTEVTNAYLSQVICLFPMAMISWFVFKSWVFNRKETY